MRANTKDRRVFPLGVRLNAAERAMLESLAIRLQRTESDVVRILIRGASHELNMEEIPQKAHTEQSINPITGGTYCATNAKASVNG